MVLTASRRSLALIVLIAVLLPALAILQVPAGSASSAVWRGCGQARTSGRPRSGCQPSSMRAWPMSMLLCRRLMPAILGRSKPSAQRRQDFIKALYSVERAGTGFAVRTLDGSPSGAATGALPSWLSDITDEDVPRNTGDSETHPPRRDPRHRRSPRRAGRRPLAGRSNRHGARGQRADPDHAGWML